MRFGKGPRRDRVLPFDFSRLPDFPGPWSIVNGRWISAGREVACLGANVTAYAQLPDTQADADAWAATLYREGYRLCRLHHWDSAVYGDYNVRMPKLDMFTSALKKVGIPWTTDGTSERCNKALLYAANAAERDKWLAQVETLLTRTPTVGNVAAWVDEPFFIGLCPVNEDVGIDGKGPWDGSDLVEATYVANMEWYRDKLTTMGCAKPVWPCNAGIPFGWTVPGEVEAYHRYTDHQLDGPPITYWDTYENDQPWNHYTPRTSRPLILEEVGKLWPSETRGLCEKQLVDYAISIGAQVIMPYARATGPTSWTGSGGTLDSYTYYNDRVRLSTARYIALMLAQGNLGNLAYLPGNSQNTGFTSTVISGPQKQVTNVGAAPIVESISGTIAVPAGKRAVSLDWDGNRVAELGSFNNTATPTTFWTELV